MRPRTLILVLVLTVLVTPAFPKEKEKERNWQTGKLISIERGVPENYGVIVPPASGGLATPITIGTWVYTVETGTMVYEFVERVGAFSDHPHPFTVGQKIKFALDAKKEGRAYLIDEKGKEFKASVVKKAAKRPAH